VSEMPTFKPFKRGDWRPKCSFKGLAS